MHCITSNRNLGDNRIHHLPTAGLISLETLKVFHNPDLREFPPKEQFPNVNNFVLSYAYHCCDFILSRPEVSYIISLLPCVVVNVEIFSHNIYTLRSGKNR